MLLNTVPVSCKNHRRKMHTLRAGKQLGFHLTLKLSWTNSGNVRSVFFTAYAVFVRYSFEHLIAQFLFCV